MTLSVRNLSIASLTLAVAVAAGWAANNAYAAQEAGRNVSISVEASGSRSETLYQVPTGMTLMVTQACQEHPAMYVEIGTRGERISYNGHGCTNFHPGFAVGGGKVLNCVNKSGEARTCVLLGRLEKSPQQSQGARFYDVDAAKE